MAYAWLRERWTTLLPALEQLTVDQEEEVARICAEEIANWKGRDLALSSLKKPMTWTRGEIRKFALTDRNFWVNPKTNEREHIALKHMNYSEEAWRAMNQGSDTRFQERLENQQYLEQPELIVARAEDLLTSKQWAELVVGLAAVTGRRLTEIMRFGEIHPKSLYSVIFSGQLKRKDLTLKPYEIPTLCESSKVVSAWSRLRSLMDCSKMDEDHISKTYSSDVSAAAERHFGELIPVRDGRTKLFAHGFRAVYARLAVFYFCPEGVADLAFLPVILGHYWSTGADEQQQRNYASSLHYDDYEIGNDAIFRAGGRRKGIKLVEPGVEVLDVYKDRKPAFAGKKGSQRMAGLTKTPSKTGFSSAKPREDTRDILDQIGVEVGARIDDDILRRLCDDYYRLKQISTLLAPYYEQLKVNVEQLKLDAPQSAVEEFVALLEQAGQDSQGKLDDEKKPFTPFGYLKSLLFSKRKFLAAYTKRHEGKDYSKLSLAQLKNTKTSEAAAERFRRAVDAIIAYNDQAQVPEQRWYINAAAVVELVDGRPGAAKEYIEGDRAAEIQAHHEKYGLHPGDNRKSTKITARIVVPDLPAGAEDQAETAETEEASEQ